ncbi:cell wall / vacuolar inhibitor of fructosidase 1-like [Vicia villosa]|uniref:cell wall / vacuolar inhibitor of fructosidase 1-like n=1 Tax=Vicia villosa TaxID=3911 RepID=UPI00273C3BE7|nr:cell wall / vacuolar inhibitor of fructosidase 1-like [Vicia villosa]
MTNLKPLTLFLFLQAIFLIISIPTTYSRSTFPSKDEKLSLIENTCRKTPNYNICIQSLKQNSGSSAADITGLAQIMVRVMKAKANEGLDKIHQLQRVRNGGARKVLSSCGDKYRAILVADIPQAVEALEKGDPKFAEDGANDAANEASYCESEFNGKSPLTIQNNAMRDVSAVTAAMVRQLL